MHRREWERWGGKSKEPECVYAFRTGLWAHLGQQCIFLLFFHLCWFKMLKMAWYSNFHNCLLCWRLFFRYFCRSCICISQLEWDSLQLALESLAGENWGKHQPWKPGPCKQEVPATPLTPLQVKKEKEGNRRLSIFRCSAKWELKGLFNYRMGISLNGIRYFMNLFISWQQCPHRVCVTLAMLL